MAGDLESGTSPNIDGDKELEELFALYVDQLNRGEKFHPQEILARHPQVGEELLQCLEEYIQSGSASNGDHNTPLGNLGDYTLRRQIGRGGMGVVYEAWQNSLDRQVALKVLPAGIAADNRAFMRFMREAKTAAQLHHPNVVSVYGMGVEQNTPYYTMELVEGETLAKVLAKIKDAEPETETPFGKKDDIAFFGNLARAFADVADGLQHAHSKGVTHRDIKPSNLILDGDGRLRILDFGLARLEGQESLTLSGDFVGTPLYMSPEQARRKKISIDHRTDVYSLGATMYEALCGRPPFRGKDHADTLSQIIERDPVEPGKVNPRVPKDLETVVLKCLRKKADDRYGTAEALAQDLLRFVRGDAIEARAQAGWERLARRLRRHRVKVGLAGILSILLCALGWLGWKREAAEREALRLLHDRVVTEATMELHQGQLTLLGRDFEYLSNTLFFFRALKFKRGRTAVEEILTRLAGAADAVPERPDALYYLALMHRMLGEDETASRAALQALDRDPGFVPAEVLAEEIALDVYRLPDSRLEAILSRFRGQEGWQEPWILAYKHARDRKWPEAAEAYGGLIAFREERAELYIGCAVEALMGRGLARLHAADFEGAKRDFAAARGLWPRFPEAGLSLGAAYLKQGNVREAERIFGELHATSRDETDEIAGWIWGVYSRLGGAEKADAWEERMTDWKRSRLRALYLCWEGRWEESAEEARKVLRASPEDLQGRGMLGWARWVLQRGQYGSPWDQERRDLLAFARETSVLFPLDPHVRAILALALNVNGHNEEALRTAEETIDLERRLGTGPFAGPVASGVILRSVGDYAKAEEVLRMALEGYGENAFLRVELARVLEEAGRDEEALAEYEKLIERADTWAEPHAGCARLLNRLGRHDQASEHARLALARFPRHTSAYEPLARALWKLGLPAEAIGAAEEGIKRLPGRVEIHVVRGEILADQGRLEEATRSYCEALTLHPEYSEAHEGLTDLLGRIKKPVRLPELHRLVRALEERAPDSKEKERMVSMLRALREAASGREGLEGGPPSASEAQKKGNRQ